jgi:hypothetical protein
MKPVGEEYSGLVTELQDRFPGRHVIVVMATPMETGTYIETLCNLPITPELAVQVLKEAVHGIEGK